jgi:beta-carotene ketolase (CrtW type)
MSIIFYSLLWGLHIPMSNLILFWLLPLSLSSIQLFYFGIFLPHRRPKTGYTNRHCAKSSYYSIFWSFVTCYHFGYHWEHHEYPHLPWYKLPLAVRS